MSTAEVTDALDRIELSPADRYTCIGKTGSGKTTFSTVLAHTVVTPELIDHDWRIWWLDSKGDPKDMARLRRAGYEAGRLLDGKPADWSSWQRRPEPGRLFFRLRDSGGLTIVEQAQHLFRLAMKRHRVLVVVDEYTQVIEGPRNAGRPLDDIEARGRGLAVGRIGNTQEPVYVPRKLISQAGHLFLFDVSYPPDIDYLCTFNPAYVRPPRRERHAFWHGWLDGDASWRYYPNLRAWRSRVVEGQAPANGSGSH